MKKTKNQKAKKNVTYNPTYKGLAINTGKYKNLGVYTNMLEPMLNQIKALLTHHSRIQLLRFDLHLPVTKLMTASAGNLVVSNFFKQVKQDLASANWNHQKNVIHFWSREVGDSINGHYHCILGISSEVRLGTFYSDTLTRAWKLIYNRWKELSDGAVSPSDTAHHVVNRNNHVELDKAFKHFSYICKVRSKDFGTGEHHKRYSSSRLKPKKVGYPHLAFDIDNSDKASGIDEYQNQFSDCESTPKRVLAQLVTTDDDAIAGTDAPRNRTLYLRNKPKKWQISIWSLNATHNR